MTFLLNRRRFLRGGTATAMGLPLLEAMLNPHGEALAGGEPLPVRYGVWFWGGGVLQADWIPDSTGPDWQPKSINQGFFDDDTAVSEYVSLVSGLDLPTSVVGHYGGRAYMLTGSYDPDLDTNGNPTAPTSDRLISEQLRGPAPYRSLDIGISRRGEENSDHAWAMSWDDIDARIPAEHSPQALFDRLFGRGVGGTEGPDLAVRAARVSVLDAVAADTASLLTKLGAPDRIRLEQHLDGIRGLEMQLQAAPPGGCTMPDPTMDLPEVDGQEQLHETNQLMSLLLAHALACDMTRTFNFKYGGMKADTFFWQTGAGEGLHTMTHDAGMQGMVSDAVRFMMKDLASTLKILADMPEGTGNVLDNCGIYCTSECGEGLSHSRTDMPVLICGKAGGSLKSGIHLDAGGDNSSKAALTVMRACGADIEAFGVGPGRVTSTLSELEV